MKRFIVLISAVLIIAVMTACAESTISLTEAPATSAELPFDQSAVEAAGGTWTKTDSGELWISLIDSQVTWLAYDSDGKLTQWSEQPNGDTVIVHDGTGAATSARYTDTVSGVMYLYTSDGGWQSYTKDDSGAWVQTGTDAPADFVLPSASSESTEA